ncbi:hypothetical protein F0562_003437 [Nyssa sinensis]|uniref:Beta-catenin-like protein 1 N-terminal domain-containing protein n=1 Tax=Nyssa sinensis TaxID=561372 RepID=A0A5J5BW12_9ASTE|nr:hypothetical protein F0562_003437 [Nyssa sinensis]
MGKAVMAYVLEDNDEPAQVLVDALIENNVLELLVQNLLQLSKTNPDEIATMYNMLTTIKNLIEVKPSVVEMAMALYKSRDPQTPDEAEMVENLFDYLCYSLMPLENKERFVKAEGVELMIVIMNQQRNQIVNAVVIVRILGAALVVPILQVNVNWGEPINGIQWELWYQ